MPRNARETHWTARCETANAPGELWSNRINSSNRLPDCEEPRMKSSHLPSQFETHAAVPHRTKRIKQSRLSRRLVANAYHDSTSLFIPSVVSRAVAAGDSASLNPLRVYREPGAGL